jgi:hypothetical protein
MAYQSLIGAQYFISSGLDATKTISGISNANPPVVASSAHGYSNNDEILILNGWEDFNESIVRASSVAANTFQIAGYNSLNTDWYPAASAAGTAQKVSGWTSLGQILAISPSGGDASFEELKPFDKRNGVKIPTGFSAASLEMTLGYDRSRTDQIALQAASKAMSKLAVKFSLPGGSFGYAYGTVSASALPMFETVLKQKVVFTMSGMFTSF